MVIDQQFEWILRQYTKLFQILVRDGFGGAICQREDCRSRIRHAAVGERSGADHELVGNVPVLMVHVDHAAVGRLGQGGRR